MKHWKNLLLGLLGLTVVLVVAGWLLPDKQRVMRSVTLRCGPQEVFRLVATPKRWPEWTASTNRFPDLVLHFQGPDTGVGATMIAAGKSSGNGVVTLTAADPAAGVAYTLDFEHGTQWFAGSIYCTNAADALRVTWTLEADLGANPIKRWAGLAMGILMGGDMEQGLANLKRKVEKKP